MQRINLVSSAYGSYEVNLKGESNYQDEIRQVILYDEDSTHQSIQEDGFTAELFFEDDNPYDRGNAIRVDIDNHTVGYLSREHASKYRKLLASKNVTGAVGSCYAAIIGRYNDELDDMLFGVRLDLDLNNLIIPSAQKVLSTPITQPIEKKNKIPLIPVKGSGCLYFLFVLPFVLVINLYILLFAGLWHGGKALWKIGNTSPRNQKISLGVIGSLMMVVLAGLGSDGDTNISPTPTIDTVSVQLTALAEAWLPYTQTAQAAITNTPLSTATLPPTETQTPLPTATIVIVPTVTTFLQILPINQSPTSPPAGQAAVCVCSGDSYNCSDFSSHASAQSCFNYCQSQGAGDIHRLDKDGNGSACESLP